LQASIGILEELEEGTTVRQNAWINQQKTSRNIEMIDG